MQQAEDQKCIYTLEWPQALPVSPLGKLRLIREASVSQSGEDGLLYASCRADIRNSSTGLANTDVKGPSQALVNQ